MTILRSLLFVPGNKANMLEKALALAPDALVPDMEDSVPVAEKAGAFVNRNAVPVDLRKGLIRNSVGTSGASSKSR